MIGHSVGPYRILERLGSGGMGEVYLAEDSRLERRVALKCPSQEWLSQPDTRERLHREARAAARLKHPNIAAVFDVLDVDERPFIVMEYVEGEGLGEAMRKRRLSVEEALQIGIQIADAVGEAHLNGVLHRDLKPGNIRVTPDGRVKVLDFGLAKVRALTVDPSAPPSLDSSLAQAGHMLGTPGYSAPEQLTGKTTDQRSDIFAMGAVLFEMVAARPPFTGADPMALALATVTEPVPSVRTYNPHAPAALESIINRALEKNPKERYQSAAQLAADLRHVAAALAERPTMALEDEWAPANPPVQASAARLVQRVTLAALSVVVLVVLLLTGIRWATRLGSPEITGPPVVAVLPFSNLSANSSNDYLGSGVADTIRTSLAAVAGISVISSAETLEAVGQRRTDEAIARRLGASWLVRGTIQLAGSLLQVNATLVGGDGRVRWGDVYQSDLSGALGLQRDVASAVADRIRGSLTEADRRQLAAAQTANPEAMSAYFRGRDALERAGVEHVDNAVAAFESATRLDPTFALAYAGLGEAYSRKYQMAKDPAWMAKAVDAAETGRRLAPDQPAIRYALAVIYKNSGRRDDAIEELDRVLTLNPGDDNAHRLLGDMYVEVGDIDRGIAQFRQALGIRPRFWRTYRSMGIAHMSAGRYAEAVANFSKIIELQPEEPAGYQLRGTAYHSQLELRQAAADYDEALKRGVSPSAYSNIGTLFYQVGRFDEASELYRKAIAARPNNATTHRNLADAYRRLKRPGDARASYERAIELVRKDLEVNPKDAKALDLLAVCEARLGRGADAASHANAALKLAPGQAEVVYKSGAVFAIVGDTRRALELVSKGLSLGYSASLAAGDDDLENLATMPAFQALLKSTAQPKSERGGR